MIESEPTRLVSLINAALVSTLGVLIALDVVSEELASALGIALGAWVLLAGEFLRDRVTPVGKPQLTDKQAENLTICETPVGNGTAT